MHFYKKLVTFFFLCISIFFYNCKDVRIDDMNKNIESLTSELHDGLNNQTALINRIIGENIPIIVPEEKEKELRNIENKITELFSKDNINEDNITELQKLYLNYISTTPPWIQETQSVALFEAKYNLDYLFLIAISKNKDISIEKTIKEFENFILLNSNYSKIEEVLSKYYELIEKKNMPIIAKSKDLLKKSETFLKDNNVSADEGNQLMIDISKQINELAANEIETDLLELNNCNTKISEKCDSLNFINFQKEYQKDYDYFCAEAKKQNFLIEKYISLQERYPVIKNHGIAGHDEDDIIIYEWKVYCDLFSRINNVKEKILPIESDIQKYEDLLIKDALSDISYANTNIAIIGHKKIIDISKLLSEISSTYQKIIDIQNKKNEFDNNKYIENYKKSFNEFKNNVISGKFNSIDYSKLQSMLTNNIQFISNDYSKFVFELDELKLYHEIKESLTACKKQIESMAIGEMRLNNIKISSVNEQLTSVLYNLNLIKNLDVKELMNEEKSLEKKFKDKLSYLEKNNDSEQKQLIKQYNTNVITLLKNTNEENNRLNSKDTFKGMKKEEKHASIINGRINLLIKLEKIDISYLYPSVQTMYSQVYGQIWATREGGEALDTEDQFKVLEASLTTEKWGLYDKF